MSYLKVPGKSPILVTKSYFTVGGGPSYDASLGEVDEMAFAIHQEKGKSELVPGMAKIRINGAGLSRPTEIQSCDRIEWSSMIAVFLDDEINVERDDRRDLALKCLSTLRQLAEGPGDRQSLRVSLEALFATLVELAGAETGFLVSETGDGTRWEIVAAAGAVPPGLSFEERRRQLLSDTVLNEALGTRKPVYVESMVGHPWSRHESVMIARIFSVACLPLVVGERVFGCAYLYTRTPGRSIRGGDLGDIGVIATQAALLIGMDRELSRRSRTVGSPFLFESPQMVEVAERIRRLAPSDLPVVVSGETGTGKELVAREVHRMSHRAAKPFVAINCGAIPSGLIESVLFGHVRGAFTGAHKDQAGKLMAANGGTLFLDEVGDLPLDLQVKLLRVLQEKTVEPIGSSQSVPVDFRVVAATHRDVEKMVARREFREDLWYRLKGAVIHVPPLRQRGDDILFLAREFLRRAGSAKTLSEECEDTMRRHAWPGNVRELEQVVQRASILAVGTEIGPEHLELQASSAPEAEAELLGLKEAQDAFTESYIRKTLEKFQGNRSKTAAHLGISERTLYRFLSPDTRDRSV